MKTQSSLPRTLTPAVVRNLSGITKGWNINSFCWDIRKERKQACIGTGNHSNHKIHSGSPFLSNPHYIYTSQTETPLLLPSEFLLWWVFPSAIHWLVFSAVTHENVLNMMHCRNSFGVPWLRSPTDMSLTADTGHEHLLKK